MTEPEPGDVAGEHGTSEDLSAGAAEEQEQERLEAALAAQPETAEAVDTFLTKNQWPDGTSGAWET